MTPRVRPRARPRAIKKGGIFTMARNEEPLSLDPIVPSDNGSIWVIYQMFDQLTTVNADSSGSSLRSRKAGRSRTTARSTRLQSARV